MKSPIKSFSLILFLAMTGFLTAAEEAEPPLCPTLARVPHGNEPQQLQQWFKAPRYGGHAFGFLKLDLLGVEATVSYPGTEGWSDVAHIDFLLRKLKAQ